MSLSEFFGYSSTDAGVTNSTPPFVEAPPDASGGAGSFLPGLLDTLTNGVNAALQYEINKQFGVGTNQGLATVDDEGNLVYRAAPGEQPVNVSPSYAAKSFFGSTPGILTIAGIGLGIVLLFAYKK